MARITDSIKLSMFGLMLILLGKSALADTVYTLGVVPQFEATRIYAIWKPIINYLEKETGYKLKLSGAPTIPGFENEFMHGKFDFAYMNPYHLIMANQEQGYRPMVRDIGRKLFGVLVVDDKSSVNTLQDLNSKVIAFPAPNALGASLQMRQELVDFFGLKFESRYVKTHDSVYLNVLLGDVAAGGGVQKTLKRQKPGIKERLRVIHKTKPVPPHPIAAHPRVPPEVAMQIRQALLDLGKTNSGAKMLSAIPMKKIGGATLQDYEMLKLMGLERFFVKSY